MADASNTITMSRRAILGKAPALAFAATVIPAVVTGATASQLRALSDVFEAADIHASKSFDQHAKALDVFKARLDAIGKEFGNGTPEGYRTVQQMMTSAHKELRIGALLECKMRDKEIADRAYAKFIATRPADLKALNAKAGMIQFNDGPSTLELMRDIAHLAGEPFDI